MLYSFYELILIVELSTLLG